MCAVGSAPQGRTETTDGSGPAASRVRLLGGESENTADDREEKEEEEEEEEQGKHSSSVPSKHEMLGYFNKKPPFIWERAAESKCAGKRCNWFPIQ